MRKASLLTLLLLGGCMNSSGFPKIRPLRPLEIPLAQYRELSTPGLTGSLMYEGGCLLFHDDGSGAVLLPVWPYGTIFNGSAVIFNQPGRTDQRVVVSEELLITGERSDWRTLAGAAYDPFQRQCPGYQPFLVSAVRPAN